MGGKEWVGGWVGGAGFVVYIDGVDREGKGGLNELLMGRWVGG